VVGCPDAAPSSTWVCRPFSEDRPGCPSYVPPLGSPCTAPEGTACFGACCGGIALGPPMACSGGFWRLSPQSFVCPCIC
jgi:hypothetical protein